MHPRNRFLLKGFTPLNRQRSVSIKPLLIQGRSFDYTDHINRSRGETPAIKPRFTLYSGKRAYPLRKLGRDGPHYLEQRTANRENEEACLIAGTFNRNGFPSLGRGIRHGEMLRPFQPETTHEIEGIHRNQYISLFRWGNYLNRSVNKERRVNISLLTYEHQNRHKRHYFSSIKGLGGRIRMTRTDA